mmetsp:Transcript_689/g.1310  ORF Transcript_689/g.1310 Transcript_689/m.1310 type:complete len:416 (+) Transcript_689:165-1412(+)
MTNDAILQYLRPLSSQDPNVVAEACSSIRCLGERDRLAHSDKLMAADLILGAMRRNMEVNVAKEGCGALAELSRTSNVKTKESLVASGTGDVVINALQTYSSNVQVVTNGCAVLVWLSWETPRNQVAFMAAGASDAALQAMQTHQNKFVAGHGCGVLANLADLRANKEALTLAGAGDAVLRAMKAYKNDSYVALQACEAIGNLAHNVDSVAALMKAGAGAAVLDAMRSHPSDLKVAEFGSWALLNLLVSTTHHVALTADGAIDIVVNAMKLYSGNENVAWKGCGALYQLAKNADNKAALMTAHASYTIFNAIKFHPGNKEVCRWGGKALKELEAPYEDIITQLVGVTPKNLTTGKREISSEGYGVCTICLDAFDDKTHVMTALNCGHCTCQDCANKLNSCHTCRQPITSRLRLYV